MATFNGARTGYYNGGAIGHSTRSLHYINGSWYLVLLDEATTKIRIYRSDDGNNWIEKDSANARSHTNITHSWAVGAPLSGTSLGKIFVAYRAVTTTVRVCAFNTVTGLWEGDVATTATTVAALTRNMDLAVRSDGDILLVFSNSGNSGLYYSRWEGSTWTQDVLLNSTNSNLVQSIVMTGNSDMAHIFFYEEVAFDMSHVSLSGTNVLGTVTDIDTNVWNTPSLISSHGGYVNDAGTHRIGILYKDATAELDLAYTTSTANPTFTIVSGVSPTTVTQPSEMGGVLTPYNNKWYALWSGDARGEIHMDVSDDFATPAFGVDTTPVSGLATNEPVVYAVGSGATGVLLAYTQRDSTVVTQWVVGGPTAKAVNDSGTIASADAVVVTKSDAYSQTILATPDLAGYWRLGETSGTTARDNSGGGYDLTYAGSYTLNQTKLVPSTTDTAVDFIPGGYASRNVVPTFQSNGVISLECWVVGDATGNMAPVALFGSGSDKGLWINFAAKIGLWASIDGSAQSLCEDPVNTVTGQLYHIVATHDGSNLRLYINGALKTTTPFAGTLHAVTTAGGFAIGRLGALTSDYFDGRIDEVAVYRRALTLAEVKDHYDVGISGQYAETAYQQLLMSTSGLIGLWPLNELTFTMLDHTHRAHGVLSGTTISDLGIIPAQSADRGINFVAGAITIPNHPDHSVNRFSVELWFNADTWVDGASLISRRDTGAGNGSFTIDTINPSGQLAFYTHIGGWSTLNTTGWTPGTTWHLVVVYDGTNKIVYQNGIQIGITSQTGTLTVPTNPTFMVATNPAATANKFDGKIDDISFYDRALTPTEIVDHYNAGAAAAVPVADSGLISGSETISTDRTVFVADSGLMVSTDAVVFNKTLTVADAGFIVGTDARTASVTVAVADTGFIVGTETRTVGAAVVTPDTGTIVGTDVVDFFSSDWPSVNSIPTTGSVSALAADGTLTFAHTTGGRANRLLIVRNHVRSGSGHPPAVSVTWNGTPLTYFGRQTNGSDHAVEFWYLKNPVANTTANVVVTAPAVGRSMVSSAVTYANVDQNLTFRRNTVLGGAAANGTTFQVTDSTVRLGDMIIAGVTRIIPEDITPMVGGEDYDVASPGNDVKGEGISRISPSDGTGEIVGWTAATSHYYTIGEIAILAPAQAVVDAGTITSTDLAVVSQALPIADSGAITAVSAVTITRALAIADTGTIVGAEGGLVPTQYPVGTLVNWARNPDGDDPLARGPNGGEKYLGFTLGNTTNGDNWIVTRDSSISLDAPYSILLTLTAAGAAKYAGLGSIYFALDGAAGVDRPNESLDRPIITKAGQTVYFAFSMMIAPTYMAGTSTVQDRSIQYTVGESADPDPLIQTVNGAWQRTAGQAVAGADNIAFVPIVRVALAGGTTAANITGLQVRLDNIDLLVDQTYVGHISGDLGSQYGWFGDPDASASYYLPLTAKTPSDSGTISSTDAVVVTQTLTVPDTGLIVGTDARAAVVTLPVADSGFIVGTETRTAVSTLTVADSGLVTGTDGRTVTTALSVIDTGIIAGTETRTPTVTIPVGDAGLITGTETRASVVTVAVADAGTIVGSDIPSLQAPTIIADPVTITGAETTAIAVTVAIADAGFITGVDAPVSTQTLVLTDTGTLVSIDQAGLFAPVIVADSGTISSTDTVVLSSSTTQVNDSSLLSGNDGVAVVAVLSQADSGTITSTDAINAAFGASAVFVNDSGLIASSDTVLIALQVSKSDSGTISGSDVVTVNVTAQPVNDQGTTTSADAVSVSAGVALNDTTVITIAESIIVQIQTEEGGVIDLGRVTGTDAVVVRITVGVSDTSHLTATHAMFLTKTKGDYRVFTAGDLIMMPQYRSGDVELIVSFNSGGPAKMVTQFTSGAMEEES